MPWRSFPRAISFAVAICLCSAGAAKAGVVDRDNALEPLLAQIRINGQNISESVVLLKDAEGRLYASDRSLRDWRLNFPQSNAIIYDGVSYHRIDSIPQITATLSKSDQSVAIQADPSAFEDQNIRLGHPGFGSMTESATGAFLNYDIFAEHGGGSTTLSGLLDFNLFTRSGVGATNFVATSSGKPQLLRLESSWTIDRPETLTSVRIGDGITRATTGGTPLRFGGLQFARNFAVNPGFVTFPLPSISSTSALPSVAEVYVNGVLQGKQDLRPGPFELWQVPVQSGGGVIQIITRDVLGRQTAVAQDYYASATMLRRGLHDFSYEAGFLRESFAVSSNDYGEFLLSTAHRYGLTDELTGEASAQISGGRSSAGVGLVTTAFDVALVSGEAKLTHSEAGNGGAVSLAVERRARSFSAGLRAEWRSNDYRAVGESDDRRTRFSALAFVDYAFRRGSLGLNYYRREDWSGRREELLGAFANVAFRRGMLQFSAGRALGQSSNTVLGISFALPLGSTRSAALSFNADEGHTSSRLSVQQNAPAQVGSSYRAFIETGARNTFQGEYRWNSPVGTWGVDFARTRHDLGVRLSAAGSVGLIGGGLFASRRLDSSFAEVRVGRHAGVHVYADNRLVGTTDKRGRLIVPNLRSFESNPIRIDPTDLPFDVHLDASQTDVRPFSRSGVVLDFSPMAMKGVLMQVHLSNGEPLPAGSLVKVEGEANTHVVAQGGHVYIEGLAGAVRLVAQWDGRRCTTEVRIPTNDDPQPLIDDLVCLEEHYAAR